MAVNEAYVPSTPFTFSNTNLVIDVPWEALSPDHVTLYTLVDTQLEPIDERKYEVRGNKIHMAEQMLDEGTLFYVRRKVPLLQPYSSVGVTHVRPQDLERALDRVIMAAQELQSRELFTHVIEDYQSLGYIEYTQGWRLGMDGSADISGHFHGSVNITSGTIDGRTVEIIGSTSHRQHMEGFADAELGTIDMPQIDGLKILASGRYISIIAFMSKLFGGIRLVQLQISKTGTSWYALPDAPNITDPNSWRGPSEGVTEIQGTQTMIGPLPMDENIDGGPAETDYYIRARGVRVDGDTTGWTLGELVTLIPSEELGPGVITETHIADDSISTPKLQAMSVQAGKIAADAIQAGHISANAVVAGKIAANAVQAGNVDANAITAREIAAGSITADEVDVNSIITVGNIGEYTEGERDEIAQRLGYADYDDMVAQGTANGTIIDDGFIRTELIDAGAITAAQINAAELSAISADLGTVTAGRIEAATAPENFNIDLDNRSFAFGDVAGERTIVFDGTSLTLNRVVLSGPQGTGTFSFDIGAMWQETLFTYFSWYLPEVNDWMLIHGTGRFHYSTLAGVSSGTKRLLLYRVYRDSLTTVRFDGWDLNDNVTRSAVCTENNPTDALVDAGMSW